MNRPRKIPGWKVSWQMLLLADFILSSCFPVTQAQDSLGRPFTTQSATAIVKFTTEDSTHSFFFSVDSETEAGTIIFTTENLHKEMNFTDPVLPQKNWVTATIIVVVLPALVAAGLLLYFFLYVRRKSHRTPTQVVSVTPLYENISPAQEVMPSSSSDADQVYQSLQHGDQNIYNELMFRQNPSEVSSVGSPP